MAITEVLPYIQIGLAVFLSMGVLLQQSAVGMGGAFGDNFSSAFHTRRGTEKVLFYITIILAVLFSASSLLALFLR